MIPKIIKLLLLTWFLIFALILIVKIKLTIMISIPLIIALLIGFAAYCVYVIL